MGLEHYQFEPTKKNYEKLQKGISQTQKESIFPINHWENLWFGKIEWCTCKNCRAEIERLTVFLAGKSMQ